MNQLKNIFKNKSASKVLDIATGNGKFINLLMEIFPDAEFTGVDPDEESLKIARENFQNKKVFFRQMSAEKLNFEDNQFDVVSISNGLHHLPHLEISISEMKRVLKTEGILIISELVSDNLSPAQENQKFYHHLKSYTDRLSGHFHHETWTRQEVLDIIQKNGIKIKHNFDYLSPKKFITETEPVEFWVSRIKSHLEVFKDKPIYEELLPKVEEFRKRIEKDGMEHATNIVIVGEKA